MRTRAKDNGYGKSTTVVLMLVAVEWTTGGCGPEADMLGTPAEGDTTVTEQAIQSPPIDASWSQGNP